MSVGRPAWMAVAEAVVLGTGAPVSAALDAALAGGVGWALGLAWPGLVAVVALLVALGGIVGLYRRRSTVEAQGLAWCLRPLAGVVLAGVPGAWALARAGVTSGALSHLGLAHLGLSHVGPGHAGLSGATLVGAAVQVGAVAAGWAGVRALAWVALAAGRRRGLGLRPTLVVAGPEEASLLRGKLASFGEAGLSFARAWDPCGGVDGLGPPPPDLAGVGQVLVGVGVGRTPGLRVLVESARTRGVPVSLAIGASPVELRWDSPRIGDLAVANLAVCRRRWAGPLCKRAGDVVLGCVALVVLAPVLALAGLAILADDGGPVMYRQTRVGRGGRPFVIYKLRSMVKGADAVVVAAGSGHIRSGLLHKIDGDPRVTRVGWLIRRLSLDELPQLVNVVRGDMSLVGPRPLPVDPSLFDPVAMGRHAVRPGMTGPWQVEGANALTYDDMITMDLAYVANWSLGLDLRILARTLPAIAVRRSAW